ncbi:MAG TPA: hypothetical protein VE908_07290 [Mycobacterium sp.]|nr:hypothetical protein [Mycobacterium sp.]
MKPRTRMHHDDGGVAVGARVRVYPGSDAEAGGIVADDFGEMPGTGVDIGDNHIADPARRWAVVLDSGNLVFVDTRDLAAE